MSWQVLAHPEFDAEVVDLPLHVQRDILSAALLLKQYGPHLGRPYADTLNGSRISNLKELRCTVGGDPWRIAYAFDPLRQAVLLVAGCKAGVKSTVFYKRLIRIAESRMEDHLKRELDR